MAIPRLQAYVLPMAPDVPVNKAGWASDSERAVLLIHDMRDCLVGSWGGNCPMMGQVVANIVALRQYCKEYNIPVCYAAQPKEQSDEDRVPFNDMWGPDLTRFPEQQKIVEVLAPNEADTILMKRRYNVFHRSPLEQMFKKAGRNQLIATRTHAHADYMTTATDAFMRDIKPFVITDALADSSRDEHLMPLKHVAERSGCVVMTRESLPTSVPASKDALCSVILPLLGESEEPMNDENLIDYGLDSVRMVALVAHWRKVHGDIDFVVLVKEPTIDA